MTIYSATSLVKQAISCQKCAEQNKYVTIRLDVL